MAWNAGDNTGRPTGVDIIIDGETSHRDQITAEEVAQLAIDRNMASYRVLYNGSEIENPSDFPSSVNTGRVEIQRLVTLK